MNLIGEHVDYYNLPVLPMAIQRSIRVEFEASGSSLVHAESPDYGARELDLKGSFTASSAGDWANYLKAAVRAVQTKWTVTKGFRASVASDLPSAAGLSSSSALLTAFTLGLLRANGIYATLNELMEVLPEGEHFVGTRGGGMDHAAVLAARAGHALLVHFSPFEVEQVPLPEGWRFLAAHSLTRAEKSGAAKARYNACREAGQRALATIGISSFQAAKMADAALLTGDERNTFLHVRGESLRVSEAVAAMHAGDPITFGRLLNESHASLRDLLKVSCPALDRIVEISADAGADGARLTGAGFGGCAIILCHDESQSRIMSALERDFYASHSEYNRDEHLIPVWPSNGALYGND